VRAVSSGLLSALFFLCEPARCKTMLHVLSKCQVAHGLDKAVRFRLLHLANRVRSPVPDASPATLDDQTASQIDALMGLVSSRIGGAASRRGGGVRT
jgi:hypothetical protein